MARQLLAVGALAALICSGCVPITEPPIDLEKAQPDKDLVSKWSVVDKTGELKSLEIKSIAVDMPEVKGNPKGLMRAVRDKEGAAFWFVTTTIGKHSYACKITAPTEPAFDQEGTYAKWLNSDRKMFEIFRYVRDGNKLILDVGNTTAVEKLMRGANIERDGSFIPAPYHTPSGWFAEYLEKTGPDKLFDGTNCLKLEREKK